MQIYSLYQLNEYIRRVLALNFPAAVWVRAEIAQINRSRGHWYLDLIEKDGLSGQLLAAQATAVLWARQYETLCKRLGKEAVNGVLREGLEVQLAVRPEYHERFGLKFLVDDLEPAYTFGKLELLRRKTLETLRAEGLLDRQRSLSLPSVMQRIAVISSEEAAGWQDFYHHLDQNPYGYKFEYTLFHTAVQGQEQEKEMLAALKAVEQQAGLFHCAAVLRGGGARMDLAGFDELKVCRAAALLPLPIFTGIGHDVDETVLDRVAHTALKTPTALADFLIQHAASFENAALRAGMELYNAAELIRRAQMAEIQQLEQRIQWNAQNKISQTAAQIDRLEQTLRLAVPNLLQEQHRQLDKLEALLQAMHPQQVLARGYSLTLREGKIVRNAEAVKEGDVLQTMLGNGEIWSKVV